MLCVRSLFLLHLYFCVCILFSDSILYLFNFFFSLSWMYNITHKRWMQRCFKNTVCWKCWLLFGCMFGAVTVCGSHKTPKPFWSRATFYIFFSLSRFLLLLFLLLFRSLVCAFSCCTGFVNGCRCGSVSFCSLPFCHITLSEWFLIHSLRSWFFYVASFSRGSDTWLETRCALAMLDGGFDSVPAFLSLVLCWSEQRFSLSNKTHSGTAVDATVLLPRASTHHSKAIIKL